MFVGHCGLSLAVPLFGRGCASSMIFFTGFAILRWISLKGKKAEPKRIAEAKAQPKLNNGGGDWDHCDEVNNRLNGKQISTLEILVPGKSYLVKMNQNAVIEF